MILWFWTIWGKFISSGEYHPKLTFPNCSLPANGRAQTAFGDEMLSLRDFLMA